jgi:hypothetical protein
MLVWIHLTDIARKIKSVPNVRVPPGIGPQVQNEEVPRRNQPEPAAVAPPRSPHTVPQY